ncbi:MAG: 1,4-alpha-glucan branching protein domain-containing protein [Bacillota bacterium]|nr:1,4-alpha-glucan branching protein domain-containing protein [Bacillota bacterium]MDW7683443.1 1,4-alpha-glucan branching protein domain-containing protein [Bacillota bacterium]
MTKGYLSLVLHAHLPYVRHPEYPFSLEEKWYFEALTETYLPLLASLERLQAEGVDYRITVSVSPTLAAMWQDEYLREKYRGYLERLLDLADKEVARTAADPAFAPLARHYRQRFQEAYQRYFVQYRCDMVRAFRDLAASGNVELITCAGTHGYLPLLSTQPEAVYAQLWTAIDQHTRFFGEPPKGIWLPECAYEYGIDDMLRELGIHYFFLDAHGILFAQPRPAFGTFSPLLTPAGVAAFGRDDESSKQVWSKTEGYPGDFTYRDFYRDIGFDLPHDYIGPYIHPDGIQIHTGFKYYRITGNTDHKEPYNPEHARQKTAEHAGNFMFNREKQIEFLAGEIGRPPIVVAPYDAELFGHWWYEGPAWIEDLFRKIHYDQDIFSTITPSEYLALGLPLQEAQPSSSSWGNQGYHEVWLNRSNDWLYRHLHMAAERMSNATADFPAAQGLQKEALDQLGRELLLAQSSDWPFILSSGTMARYARERAQDHIIRFNRLLEQLYNGRIDQEWLAQLQAKDNLFPHLDYHIFAPQQQTVKVAAPL